MLDFTDVPVIDNHCHAVDVLEHHRDVHQWRRLFSESPFLSMQTDHVAHTAFYHRLIRSLAVQLGVPATEADVLAARNALGLDEIVGDLFTGALIGGVVIDTGFPAPERAMPVERFVGASHASYRALLRLEVLFQQLIGTHSSYDDLRTAVAVQLADLAASGYAGCKSVVGYRTGLDIERWTDEQAREAFAAARDEVARVGTVRLGYKPLLDTLLHQAFGLLASQGLPVQFHVGYGDPDADLRRANPLELRSVLEEPAYRGLPIVLLHGCWPYFREGAYLAAVYDNVHLDLSYAIPFLSLSELRSMTRAAFGAAPFSKLLYSSDGVRVPELHWMGARDGRRVIGEVLGEMVADGDLDLDQATASGRAVLADNAARLYGF